MPGKKTILLLLALAAVAIAGCGGGGDETTDSTAATVEEPQKLSKAELIEQGDDICAETNAAVGALSAEVEASSLPETAEKTSNLYIGMVEQLQELGAPEGAESGFTSFMEAAEEFAKVEGEVKLATEREDTEALGEASTEAGPALEEFETQAETYGFKECSEGPHASLGGPGSSAEGAESGEEFEGEEEAGGVEPEAEYVEPEYEEEAPPVEEAPETGGAGGGAEVAPEPGGESGGGSESGGVGPG